MKRWLTKIVLFLLLGAIVNVAVAWGCAWWSEEPSGVAVVEYEPFQMNGTWWLIATWSYFGTQVYAYRPFPTREAVDEYVSFFKLKDLYKGGNPPSWLRLPRVDAYGDKLSGPLLIDVGRGWPAVALSYGLDTKVEGDLVLPVSRVSGGFKMGEYRQPMSGFPRVVPLRPIRPGFAINTVFYAALLWMVTLGPFTARRIIRRKRQRCIKCGYDLRGAAHDRCPECGAATPLQVAARS